jgi:hypothetical protein
VEIPAKTDRDLGGVTGMKREEAEDIDVRFINARLLQPLIILDLTA